MSKGGTPGDAETPERMGSERMGDVRHGFAPGDARQHGAADAPPLADVAAQLIDDIKATAATEMALLQARAALVGDGARRAAMWGAIAGGTLLTAVVVIVFGVILAIVPHTGAVVATLLVGGALLVGAGIAGWLARSGALDIGAAFAERGDDVHWKDQP